MLRIAVTVDMHARQGCAHGLGFDTLYPEGRVPWPLGYRGPHIYGPGPDREQWQPFKDYAAEPAPAPERTAPVQLDLFDALEGLS